jgi:hypothetical protein
VFHEFEGYVTASIVISGTLPIQGSGSLTRSRIGTYAQFTGSSRSAFELPDTGWLGFARVGYRTGDKLQCHRRAALPAAENRARHPEMAMKARPSEGHDWTGPYMGVSAGRTACTGRLKAVLLTPDYAGYLAGAQTTRPIRLQRSDRALCLGH